MDCIGHVVDYNLGPVVQVTIGLSFAEANNRRSRLENGFFGKPVPSQKTVSALIDPSFLYSAVSRELLAAFDPNEIKVESIEILAMWLQTKNAFTSSITCLAGQLEKGSL